MRGVFDEREAGLAAPRQDTELTLGSTTLLLIFFALVLLCGLCFGLGYSMGRHGSQDPSFALAPAGDIQTIVHADGARPKPSANPDASTASQSSTSPDQQASAGSNTAPASAQNSSAPAATVASNGSSQPVQLSQIRPAFGPGANPIQAEPPAVSAVAPALAAISIMVQIAAVAQPEDADVLKAALHKRGYAVVARREPLDGLIHVRIGPFKTHGEADAWRQKLLNDGYNAIEQP